MKPLARVLDMDVAEEQQVWAVDDGPRLLILRLAQGSALDLTDGAAGGADVVVPSVPVGSVESQELPWEAFLNMQAAGSVDWRPVGYYDSPAWRQAANAPRPVREVRYLDNPKGYAFALARGALGSDGIEPYMPVLRRDGFVSSYRSMRAATNIAKIAFAFAAFVVAAIFVLLYVKRS